MQRRNALSYYLIAFYTVASAFEHYVSRNFFFADKMTDDDKIMFNFRVIATIINKINITVRNKVCRYNNSETGYKKLIFSIYFT